MKTIEDMVYIEKAWRGVVIRTKWDSPEERIQHKALVVNNLWVRIIP